MSQWVPAAPLLDSPQPFTGEEGIRMTPDKRQAYWKRNLGIVVKLLVIWFVVSYGLGILLHDWLDNFKVFGFKLGFWFAQQGSIYVFVVLIFAYVGIMNKLDREYDVHED
jgi:putative solute:sodium symporter small subunit